MLSLESNSLINWLVEILAATTTLFPCRSVRMVFFFFFESHVLNFFVSGGGRDDLQDQYMSYLINGNDPAYSTAGPGSLAIVAAGM